MRSKEATTYIMAVAVTTAPVRRNLPANGLTGRLAVEIYVYPPDRRRRDLDNILKNLLDSMQHAGVYKDDQQIDRLLVIRMPDIGGYVDVVIKEI